MNWKFLPAALLGALIAVTGCSSNRVDPALRQRQAESTQMTALKQDNDALRQDQLQSQRQIDALTKQLAADREEQRKFREMMSTNFDLLEQSVSMTLSKSIDKNGKGPTPGPAGSAGPGGMTAPIPGNDDMPRSASTAKAASSAAPRLAPVPAMGPVAAQPYTETPLLVPNASGSDDQRMGPAKSDARMSSPASTTQSVRPGSSASSHGTAMKTVAPVTAASVATAGHSTKATLVADNGKAYQDPDLEDPASPRQLSANRAAKPLYEKGFVLFGNRQYEQSILVYQNFLNRYPDDIYSDNAQFWIGEAYLRMDKLEDAEASYRKVLREYAHKSTLEGYKTPDAIYRIGQIFGKRNNANLARYYLQQVAQRFPDSSAGRKAQRDLDGGVPMTSQAVTEDFTTGG
jgi:tol-pal system protein YbgF